MSSEDIEKIKKYKEKQAQPEKLGSTYEYFKQEVSRIKKGQSKPPEMPKHSEYVIIGGGIMGSAIAHALKQRAPDSFDVTVIERDPKVTFSFHHIFLFIMGFYCRLNFLFYFS